MLEKCTEIISDPLIEKKILQMVLHSSPGTNLKIPPHVHTDSLEKLSN